jgi:hypothetical protein
MMPTGEGCGTVVVVVLELLLDVDPPSPMPPVPPVPPVAAVEPADPPLAAMVVGLPPQAVAAVRKSTDKPRAAQFMRPIILDVARAGQAVAAIVMPPS